MKFERLIITNFRQYYGEQTVRFADNSNQNITIFHGVNGAGKTSLFAAINWCLYGEGVEGIGQIISKEAVREANSGDEVITKVVMRFVHGGQRYLASRQLKGRKQSDGTVIEMPDVEFLLMRTRFDGQSARIDNPIGTMNAILPANVRTYFLFDGEKIDNFARPESGNEVRYAIYGVLNLSILERTQEHLAKVARDLRSELKKSVSGELQALIEQNEQLRSREDEIDKRIGQISQEISAAQGNIQHINDQMRAMEAAQALQKQYDLLTQQYNEREEERKSLVLKLRDYATQGSIVLIHGALSKAQAILDDKRQRGEIPSNIRQQFIRDLLEQHRCICGRSFSDHDNAADHLRQLLEHSVSSRLEDDVLTTSASIQTLLDRGGDIRQGFDSLMLEKARLEDATNRIYSQRSDIELQQRGSPISEVSSLSQRRDEYEQDVAKYQAEKGHLTAQKETVHTQINDIEAKIATARKNEERERILSRKVSLAQSASDATRSVYTQFAEAKRLQIEERTKEIFHSLAWKSQHFHDVRLTSDYQLQIIDRWGQQARPELSAGERQVLSLSFIAAMSSVAEREAPLVMDTPFGRLSSAHRESITARIPELASQLILFVTDEELRDQALANLQNRIGAEYILHFDPTTSCTTIEEQKR